MSGAHERDVAIQFGVTVEEIRALMYKNAREAIGVEGVERERFKMLDRLDGLELIYAPKAAAGGRARPSSFWSDEFEGVTIAPGRGPWSAAALA